MQGQHTQVEYQVKVSIHFIYIYTNYFELQNQPGAQHHLLALWAQTRPSPPLTCDTTTPHTHARPIQLPTARTNAY